MVWLDRIRLRSSSSQTRRKALESLTAAGKLPEPKLLIASLGDLDARVRLAAAQVLQQQADPAHLTHFLTLLADEHFEVRLTAIQFLGRISDPGVAQALVARLADSDSDVRRAAAQALGEIRSPVAIELLVLSLTDAEPAVRHAAAAALEQIDPRWVRTDAAQRAIPRLEALRGEPIGQAWSFEKPKQNKNQRQQYSQHQATVCCLATPTKLHSHRNSKNGRNDKAHCHDNHKNLEGKTAQLASVLQPDFCVNGG